MPVGKGHLNSFDLSAHAFEGIRQISTLPERLAAELRGRW